MSVHYSKKKIFYAAILLTLHGYAQTEDPQVDLSKLDSFFVKFAGGQRFGTYYDRSQQLDALSTLRSASLDRRTWERIASEQKNPDAEAAFRIARHAYRLGLEPEVVRAWIEKIPKDPDKQSAWYANGQYLLGTQAIQRSDIVTAKEFFAMSSQSSPKNSSIEKLSTLALARISFHEKDFARAEQLYSSLMGKPLYDESALHELSWTHFNQGEIDLSYTDIYLLFSLHPDSDELFNTSSLLGKIYEKNSNLEAGSEALEKLSLRFSIEEENILRAFRAYKGVENELLLELDPSIDYAPTRAILPSLAKKKLRKNGMIINALAELQELERNKSRIREGLTWIKQTQELWGVLPEASLDSLTILAWANSVEREVLRLGPSEPPRSVSETKLLLQDIKNALQELDEVQHSLLAADEYLSSQWLILSGERAAMAILAKQDIRKQLANIKKLKQESADQRIALEFHSLRSQYEFQMDEKSYLFSKRTEVLDESRQKTLENLDRIRVETEGKARQSNLAWLKQSKQVEKSFRTTLLELDQTTKKFLAESKQKIANLLPSLQEEIKNNLNEYEWSIAEARYKLFKSLDAKTIESKKTLALQETSLSELYDRMDKDIPKPIRESEDGADENIKIYRKASDEFVTDIAHKIRAQGERSKTTFDLFREKQESVWQDSRDTLRERAIVAFQRYTNHSSDKNRTPYALFRLAQLYVDRTRTSVTQTQGDQLAAAPLERIKQEFPNYPFMDRTQYMLGTIYAKQGRLAQSQATYLGITHKYPDSPLRAEVELRIAENFFNDRELSRAREHYAIVMEKGNEDLRSKAMYKTAWCHYLEGAYSQAIATFTKLLELSESPDPETKKLYSDYVEEASEYIAFSLYRQKNTLTPQEIVNLVSLQTHTEKIFLKTAEIYGDRGDLDNAAKMYDILILHFSTSPNLPDLFEKKIQIADKAGDIEGSIKAKSEAAFALSPTSAWRTANQGNVALLKKSDDIASNALFDIGAHHEQKKREQEATSGYEKLVNDYPDTKPAYEARFRLGQLAYQNQQYKHASLQFDLVVRNEKYNHRFQESIYNIVACREAEVNSLGNLASSAKKDPVKTKSITDEFANSVDNLATRSPKHPKVAEAYYRSAEVYQLSGQPDEAVKRYQWISQNYPESDFKEPALIAALNTRMENRDWQQAQQFAEETLKNQPTLSEKTRTVVASAQATSAFALADSPETFLKFQAAFPDSDLASKAVFNAVLLSRKNNDRESEEKALQLLLTKYETSPEARTAYLEKAVLLDSVYEVDQAVVEYEKALASQGLAAQQREQAYVSMAKLIAVSEIQNDKANKLMELSKKVKQPLSTEILLLSQDHPEVLDRITKIDAPNKDKSMANAKLSALLWKRGLEKEAQKRLLLAQQLYAKSPTTEAYPAMHELANASYEKTIHNKKNFDAMRLTSNNPAALAKSFQRKAAALAALEKAGLSILQYPSAPAQIKGLEALSETYRSFSQEMSNIELPAEISKSEREKFRATMKNLSDPLLEKADQAKGKALEIATSTGTPLNMEQSKVLWADQRLPEIPEAYGYDRESTFPVTEKTVEYLNKGIESMKNFWNLESREIASNFFHKTLAETPNYPPAIYNLSILQLFDGKTLDFDRQLSLLKNVSPKTNTQLLMATKHYLEENFTLSLELAQSHLKDVPNSTESFVLEILSLIALGKKAEALQQAKLFLKKQYKNPRSHRLLAKAYEEMGQDGMAKFILSRAISIFPKDTLVMGDLGILMTSTQEKPLQSKLIQDAALDKHPENLARLSKVRFDAGEVQNAIGLAKEAVDLGGKFHPKIVYSLKVYQEKLGEKQ